MSSTSSNGNGSFIAELQEGRIQRLEATLPDVQVKLAECLTEVRGMREDMKSHSQTATEFQRTVLDKLVTQHDELGEHENRLERLEEARRAYEEKLLSRKSFAKKVSVPLVVAMIVGLGASLKDWFLKIFG